MDQIKIYASDENGLSSLLLRQSYEAIKSEILNASVVTKENPGEEKSFFVSAIVVPVIVGVSTSIIYDALRAAYKRINSDKENKESITITIEDSNGNKQTITLGDKE